MGWLTQLRFIPYRVIRRIGTADISCVFGVELVQLRPTLLPPNSEFSKLSESRIRALIVSHPELFNEDQLKEVVEGRTHCFSMHTGNKLAAYAWVAIGDVPAELNHNGDLRAGLPIEMPDDTAFIHNVFVMPEFRGRRFFGAMMSGLEAPMRAQGVSRLLLTVDAMNESSLKAVRQMGFQYLGCAWLFRLHRFCRASYPPSPLFQSIRIGRYAGDCRNHSQS